MSTQIEFKYCCTCDASLEQGYSYTYKDNVLVSVICFPCASVRDLKEYQNTKIISTSFATSNLIEVYDLDLPAWSNLKITLDKVIAALTTALLDSKYSQDELSRIEAHLSLIKVYKKIKEFESKVWFSGLQAICRSSKVNGVSAKYENFSVLTYCMAGRCMITIEDGKGSITTICDETSSESTMGERSLNGTEEKMIALLDRAITLYHEGKLVFSEDKEVSYL